MRLAALCPDTHAWVDRQLCYFPFHIRLSEGIAAVSTGNSQLKPSTLKHTMLATSCPLVGCLLATPLKVFASNN